VALGSARHRQGSPPEQGGTIWRVGNRFH